MAKSSLRIGFSETVDKGDGVYEDVITERTYKGEITRDARRLANEDRVLDDLQLEQIVRIVGDGFAYTNYFAIRYVTIRGVRWRVSNVELNHPRLVLYVGGLYNGPTA